MGDSDSVIEEGVFTAKRDGEAPCIAVCILVHVESRRPEVSSTDAFRVTTARDWLDVHSSPAAGNDASDTPTQKTTHAVLLMLPG